MSFGLGGVPFNSPCRGLSNQAAINACMANPSAYAAYGSYEQQYEAATAVVHSSYPPTITIPASATTFFGQYLKVTEPDCYAHYAPSFTGTVPIQGLVTWLLSIQQNYGPNAFNIPDSTLSFPGALLGAMVEGDLQLTPKTASNLLRQCISTGIAPQSAWETYGVPLLYMAAAITGGEFLGASGAAAGTSGSTGLTTGGLEATNIPTGALGPATLASPIDLSGLTAVGGGGLAAAGAAGASSVGSALGTAGTIAKLTQLGIGVAGATGLLGGNKPGPVSSGVPAGAPAGGLFSGSNLTLWLLGGGILAVLLLT